MTSFTLSHVSEPLLRFGFEQSFDDPRTGLFLFGPLKERRPTSMRVGIVGTPQGIAQYRAWVRRITSFIPAARPDAIHQVAFPGFEATFRTPWPADPVVELPVSPQDVSRALRLSDRYVGMFEVVSLFESPIRRKLQNDDAQVDLWYVIVPEEVYTFGRPLSRVPAIERVSIERRINARMAARFRTQPSLFAEDMSEARVYAYDLDFHNQLKARLLDKGAVVQIVRDTSLAEAVEGVRSARRLQDQATIAWNLCTTSFFKAGGRPWKLHAIRDGVCYVGIVFKKDVSDPSGSNACCGAQMFLDSGDGLVFKGALGKWSSETKEFHLSKADAKSLLSSVLSEYENEGGNSLQEVFLHAKTRFNDEEWEGFWKHCRLTSNWLE